MDYKMNDLKKWIVASNYFIFLKNLFVLQPHKKS